MRLHRADPEEADLIAALLDDYLDELAAHREVRGGANELRGYPHLAAYWTDPGRHPFLIRSCHRVAGFALVRDSRSTGCAASEVAEFYIEPAHRRCEVGRDAVREILRLFPGRWKLQVHSANSAALEFWASCVTALCTGKPRVRSIVAADGRRLQYNFVAAETGA